MRNALTARCGRGQKLKNQITVAAPLPRNAALLLLTIEGAPMNLVRAQKALLAMQRHHDRHLRVRRPVNQADVREMVREGLVSTTSSDGSPESATVLGTLTDAGLRFLQMFPARFRFCDAR
jgi:hypothetical protein